MSDDAPFVDTSKTTDDTEQREKGVISALKNPKECECGEFCIATTDFVESQAMIMDIWQCEDCGNRYHRGRY